MSSQTNPHSIAAACLRRLSPSPPTRPGRLTGDVPIYCEHGARRPPQRRRGCARRGNGDSNTSFEPSSRQLRSLLSTAHRSRCPRPDPGHVHVDLPESLVPPGPDRVLLQRSLLLRLLLLLRALLRRGRRAAPVLPPSPTAPLVRAEGVPVWGQGVQGLHRSRVGDQRVQRERLVMGSVHHVHARVRGAHDS